MSFFASNGPLLNNSTTSEISIESLMEAMKRIPNLLPSPYLYPVIAPPVVVEFDERRNELDSFRIFVRYQPPIYSVPKFKHILTSIPAPSTPLEHLMHGLSLLSDDAYQKFIEEAGLLVMAVGIGLVHRLDDFAVPESMEVQKATPGGGAQEKE